MCDGYIHSTMKFVKITLQMIAFLFANMNTATKLHIALFKKKYVTAELQVEWKKEKLLIRNKYNVLTKKCHSS